jgi:hypothetical protein
MTTGMGRAALLAGLGGVALFLVMFLSWFGASGFEAELAEEAQRIAEELNVDPGSSAAADTTESGWSSMGWFGVAVIVAAIALSVGFAAVFYTGVSVSLPVALSSLAAGAGGLAFLVVLYRAINPPGSGDVDREIGLYLGLLATAAIAVGGYLGMQEERSPSHG